MGQLDQFAKDTFAVEAASVTHGGVSWQLPPELGMSEVRLKLQATCGRRVRTDWVTL